MPLESVYNINTNTYKNITDTNILYEGKKATRILDTIEFSGIYKKLDNGTIKYYKDEGMTQQYSSSEVNAERNLLKQHIKECGAVSADMYINENLYYNAGTSSYNYNNYGQGKTQANHVVSLIGWDDNYDKNNFKQSCKPTSNGAYIALNSYGENWGNGGIFYISYEDSCIEEGLMGITKLEEDSGNIEFDGYDPLGMNLGIPLGKEVEAGAVFNHYGKSDYDQYVSEVGIYVASTSGIEVSINPENTNLDNTQVVAVPKEPLELGYHVIKLANPIKITGNSFAVKVKYTNNDMAYLPIEANYKKFGLSGTSGFYDGASANNGETFFRNPADKSWLDVNKSAIITNDKLKHSLQGSSACIKVFYTYQKNENGGGTTTPSGGSGTSNPNNDKVPVERITLQDTSLEVEVGKRFTIPVTVYPWNATNKKVQWITSDSNVASVSNLGVIVAKAEGKVVISAISEDGQKKASCEITVVKAKQENPDSMYSPSIGNWNSAQEKLQQPQVNNSGNTGNAANTSNSASPANTDNTVAKMRLPAAGTGIIIGVIIVVCAVAGFVFVKYYRMRDIK